MSMTQASGQAPALSERRKTRGSMTGSLRRHEMEGAIREKEQQQEQQPQGSRRRRQSNSRVSSIIWLEPDRTLEMLVLDGLLVDAFSLTTGRPSCLDPLLLVRAGGRGGSD